jgi:hypothetical protein
LVAASHATIKDEKRIKTVALTSNFECIQWKIFSKLFTKKYQKY